MKVRSTIDSGINIQQMHTWCEFVSAFPNLIDIDGPCMGNYFNYFASENILSALKALRG